MTAAMGVDNQQVDRIAAHIEYSLSALRQLLRRAAVTTAAREMPGRFARIGHRPQPGRILRIRWSGPL